MKLPVYTMDGTPMESMDVPDAMFAVKPKVDLLHRVATALRGNLRIARAHTKKRGEVSGGGKKPWKQKGTGRARQGSIRSPQWRGGGVVFGPTPERNFKTKINKKERQLALRMALSDKTAHQRLIVVNEITLEQSKTKRVATMLNALAKQTAAPVGTRFTLLVADSGVTGLGQASRNLAHVTTVGPSGVHLLDVLTSHCIVATKKAVEELSRRTISSSSV